jgi:hypothetical protein
MAQLRVKCKTEGCPAYLLIGEAGVEKIGNSFRIPMPVKAWTRRYRCPECGNEHLYSSNDVEDAKGFPV